MDANLQVEQTENVDSIEFQDQTLKLNSINCPRGGGTCVIGDSEGDMVGDSCLARPLRCSAPGDKVRGLMGAGRRRGELPDRRRDELMEGLLRDDCSWQLLSDAWIEGLLSEDERPAGTTMTTGRGTLRISLIGEL